MGNYARKRAVLAAPGLSSVKADSDMLLAWTCDDLRVFIREHHGGDIDKHLDHLFKRYWTDAKVRDVQVLAAKKDPDEVRDVHPICFEFVESVLIAVNYILAKSKQAATSSSSLLSSSSSSSSSS